MLKEIRPTTFAKFVTCLVENTMPRFSIEMINNMNDPTWKDSVSKQLVEMTKGALDCYRGQAKKSADDDYIIGYNLMFEKKTKYAEEHKIHRRTSARSQRGGKK